MVGVDVLRPVSGEVVESFIGLRRIDDNEIAAGPHLYPDQHQVDAFGMIQLQQPINNSLFSATYARWRRGTARIRRQGK